jgi:hypothetical protein
MTYSEANRPETAMAEPTDPISLAILDLEAESKAMQAMIGFLLVSSPEAFANLAQLEPVLGDLATQFALTDRQIAKLQGTVSRTLEQARLYQSKLGK